MSQLPLPVALPDQARMESFYPGPNRVVLDYMRRFSAQSDDPVVWLWGPPGSGKSHLCQALCRAGIDRGAQCAYFALAGQPLPPAQIVAGWDRAELLCFDDIDRIAGNAEWEAALFTLFNQGREHSARWLVTSSAPPAAVAIQLHDLRSRLSWGPVFELGSMEDDDRLRALQLRASFRGLELPEETGRYLLARYPRDSHSLFRLLDQLDRASLSAQRRLTIPFVKSVVPASR
jgi:DnaA family protein